MSSVEPLPAGIGGCIRALRLRRCMNQTQLGRAVGVEVTTVSSWETGCRGVPLSRLPGLAAALKVTPATLVAGLGTAEEPPATPKRRKAYVVRGGRLHIHAATVLDRREVVRILRKLL